MIVTCQAGELKEAWGVAAKAARPGSPRPVLGTVRLEAEPDGTATLQATDNETWVALRAHGVGVEKPGVALLPAEEFGKILATLGNNDTLTISGDRSSLAVESEGSRWELALHDAGLFPAAQEFPSSPPVTLKASDLLRLVRRSSFAAEKKAVSCTWALSGCLCEYNAGMLTLTGFEGHILARQSAPAERASDETTLLGIGVPIIPRSFLEFLASALDDDGPEVEIAFESARLVHVRCGVLSAVSRLVEGNFPLQQLARAPRPEAYPQHARVPMGPLADAIKRASITSDAESRRIRFEFAPGRLSISSPRSQKGRASASLAVEGDAVGAFEVDHRLIAPLPQAFAPTDVLTCSFVDNRQPPIFHADDFLFFITPINLEPA